MKIWKVKFGNSITSIDGCWFVRAETFVQASQKASKTAKRADKDFNTIGRDVVSLELLGEEEN